MSHLAIFLSYGHDDLGRQLALRLVNDLEQCGHQVWIDKRDTSGKFDHASGIRPGDVWPISLDAALEDLGRAKEHARLLVLLTPHAVRGLNSVVLGEIAKAHWLGVPVIPVIVATCDIPTIVAHIEPVDMTDCVPIPRDHGSEASSQWMRAYERRLNQLLDVLACGPKFADTGILRHLEALNFEDLIEYLTRRFSGREWVFEEIDQWLSNPQGAKIFWITGLPGIGKSALAAEFCRRRRGVDVVAHHFCDFRDAQDSLDPGKFVRSLTRQMGERVPGFKEQLGGLVRESLISESPRSLFARLVAGPLSKVPTPHQPLVVVVDGLDEATSGGHNAFAQLLGHSFRSLPSWLRLVVTSRPDEPEVDSEMDLLSPHVLDADSPRHREDVRAYLRTELAGILDARPDWRLAEDKMIEALGDKSEWLFLIAAGICEQLRDPHSGLSLDRLEQIPTGRDGYFKWNFRRRFPDRLAYQEEVVPALRLFVAAREPLPASILRSAMGWDEARLQRFREAVRALFPSSGTGDCERIRPVHKSLLDWLTNSKRAGSDFVVATNAGHHALAEAGFQEYESGAHSLSAYFVRHLPGHLRASGRLADCEHLLTHLDYLAIRCEAGDVAGLIRDYLEMPRIGEVPHFGRWIRARADTLSRSPGVLHQLAANQPEGFCIEQAARQHFSANRGERWLKELTKSDSISPLLGTLAGHEGFIHAMALSPGGETLVTGSADSSLRLWNLETGAEKVIFRGHGTSITCCAVAPDCTKVLSGDQWGTVKLWDAQRGTELRTFPCLCGIGCCSFSPDGRLIVSGDNGVVKVWDAATGAEIADLHGHRNAVCFCAFSPDGKHVVSASYDCSIRIWDLSRRKTVFVLNGHESSIDCCLLSSDGLRILSAGSQELLLWDASNGKLISNLVGHDGTITAINFSPDRERVVSGSWDKTARIWDAKSGAELIRLEGHDGTVTACTFSPDGALVATGAQDGTVRLWRSSDGIEVATFLDHAGGGVMSGISEILFSPDGSWLVSASWDHTAKLWDAEVASIRPPRIRHRGSIRDIKFLPGGSRIASASEDGTWRVWDGSSGAEAGAMKGCGGTLTAIACSPDGRRILSSSTDKTLRLWHSETGLEIGRFQGHESLLSCCAFAPDGNHLASGAWDHTLKIWDTESFTETATLEGHEGDVEDCAYLPNGRHILSRAIVKHYNPPKVDKAVRLWEVPDGKEVWALSGEGCEILSWAASPSGNLLIFGGDDGKVRVWRFGAIDVALLFAHESAVSACAFSPGGDQFATGSRDGILKLWDPVSLEEISLLQRYSGNIFACGYSPDGRIVAAASRDSGLQLWCAASKTLLGEWPEPKEITTFAWSPDGTCICLGDSVGIIHILHLEGFQIGPPVVTPWHHPVAGAAIGCPVCRRWSRLGGSDFGGTYPCCNCGTVLMVSSRPVDGDWQCLERAWM